ncbi:Holliday junction DNA helicase RuvA [Alteromonas sp. V450]|uniref:Holliday junction resolvase RuvX n=1 Tax=Alteromonas sp. V450 TaxID=1912139 RepID=UPI0008FF5949|nr:Holliday junction resolvase RuvX [Alteromonas sp. V450]OJF69085.1 Holliday junction DNA helicase RuvA [Alteromonas sp. V450]|tara:strand:+ start:884 stop:1315 length:432 start_codon:yes stop_codon:yes gene_type:complete
MPEQGNRTVLTFDFGTKSIGVAIGQEVTGTASPLSALKARDGIPDWILIQKLIDEWQPQLLVVGLPLNMDGTEQDMTQRAKKFANRLHGRFRVNVETCDERLSTADAKSMLFELGGYKKLTKDKIDSVSACVIFASWNESQYD